MMLVVMAGLPATGKSAIAGRLRAALGAVVLNKDEVRTVLFPAAVLDYSTAQDDVCMAAIYQAAAVILQTFPRQAVILDGRTFLRSYQIFDIMALAASLHTVPRIIECVCADEIAKARLESGLARGEHPAGNRTYALYAALKAAAEPIPSPRLLLDTGKTPLEECVSRCIAYLERGGEPSEERS
jgi:adenylylsulfate kinase